MSLKKRYISLFFSVCLAISFVIQSAHTYTHLVADYFSDNQSHHTEKQKVHHTHNDNCQICHFAISPFTANFTSQTILFLPKVYHQLNANYVLSKAYAFIEFIKLRGPPSLLID